MAAAKRKQLAMMLDTKGPEIRTAMLRGGKDIQITKGQEVGSPDGHSWRMKLGVLHTALCYASGHACTCFHCDATTSALP